MLRIRTSFMEDQRLLASVALFRKLYDNKKDSYDVLAEFLRASINIKSLWRFTVEDCSEALKTSFGFQIPSAVLKSCLRRRLKDEVELAHGVFTVTEKFQRSEDLEVEIASAQSEQERIIQQLVGFASKLNGRVFSTTEEEQLRDDFHQYFLGGLKPGKNHICISQFIISKSDDADFTEKLNNLEEGLILYQGIEYSPEAGEVNSWRAEYTIYLDTEILFWANGYDGALFESIFKEFIDLVREMNLKAAEGAKINLKYFPEAKQEIDSIFKAGEHILAGRRLSDPSRTAMKHLLNGCATPSDVIEKKGKFYALLSRYRIYEEVDRNYYEPSEYNCESIDLVERLAKEFSETPREKIENSLKYFTKINYLRKGVSNKGLEQSKAILVSGKNISRQLAFHPSVLQLEGAIPYSTDIEYLTERLWFKLGKGFGGGRKTPVAFDVVARAQVIISTQIGSKISGEFKSLIAKVESGEMSANDASFIVSDLKNRPVKPEELNADSLEEYTNFLHADSIEAGVRGIRLLEGKAQELEEKSKELEKTSKAFDMYRQQVFAKEVREWREGIKKLKVEACRAYCFNQFSLVFLVISILIAVTLIISSAGDSWLSRVGFAVTVAALIISLVSLQSIRGWLAKRVRASLRRKIRDYDPKPKIEYN